METIKKVKPGKIIPITRMHEINALSEDLADKLTTLYDSDQLTEDILKNVRDLVDVAYNLRVDPALTRIKIFSNFLRVCYKRGMGLMHAFHQYTMDMNNCYSLAGTEPGGDPK